MVVSERPRQPPPQQANQQGGSTSTSEASKIDEIFEMLKEMKKENEMRDKAFNAFNKQVGQMAEDLSKRNPGTLPSDITINPQHHSASSKNTRNVHISADAKDIASEEENVWESIVQEEKPPLRPQVKNSKATLVMVRTKQPTGKGKARGEASSSRSRSSESSNTFNFNEMQAAMESIFGPQQPCYY
ncbi:hypothetical protein E3N88_19816 [Mikania micrantha]|uniref:Uncharacterized protein n=1 Tax=Mikania micrantha TaxID=192012 RepID=A0A5N6NQX7_9ASTR|nr:hypothetical protein E3N88_19816 [Mikania micrantha]